MFRFTKRKEVEPTLRSMHYARIWHCSTTDEETRSDDTDKAMLKAILFDAYGTLIDTGNGSVLATEAILRKNNCAADAATVYARWKKYHREHIDSLASFMNEEDIFRLDIRRLYKDYGIDGDPDEDVKIMLATLGTRCVFPETVEIVNQLRTKYRAFVASTSDTQPLLIDLEQNRLIVDGCFTSESLRVYKPRKDFYLRILHKAGLAPEEAIFVGDSPIDDVAGPQSVGLRTVWVNRKSQILKNEPMPDHEIPDLRGLPAIL